ncbi:23S rRNA (guanosine(2251)-2'-O)-methyltransferase RlmB [Candidatus Gracilibacteria bacterium]|nr:23S rRNA (guanosine(2251)-2'-O)-methyltransferase RlmB [Candidatus Gracilibacteria bacterium]
MTEKTYLYGRNPLKEAILASKRNGSSVIEKLFLTKKAEEDPKLTSLIQTNKLTYDVVTYQEIESMVGRDAVHQGVCALLNDNLLYTSLEEVLEKTKTKNGNSLFVLLDKLQDPHNVGAIIRTAVAFGADAILLPDHEQVLINGTVIKTSSGMSFAIPIVKIGNVNTTLTKLKDNRFWTYGLAGNGDTKLQETKFDTDTVIVVGGESEGIRTRTLELCDFKISIETDVLCESLNASNASAVTLYEFRKQNPTIG